jgi:hypothetical protein
VLRRAIMCLLRPDPLSDPWASEAEACLLPTLQRVMRAIPGGLALAVALMGAIPAAAAGIIGASAVMLTLLTIPTVLEQGYHKGLAAGTAASAGTLGMLIPPLVMLMVMGDMLSVSLGQRFVAALTSGLRWRRFASPKSWCDPRSSRILRPRPPRFCSACCAGA